MSTYTPRKECLLFLSHHTRTKAMASLKKLRADCSHLDIIPVFDQTQGTLDVDNIPGAWLINCEYITRLLDYPTKHQHHPGTFWPKNIDLPLMGFFQQQPHYDYYWVIEYDVRYTGNWQDFFKHFQLNNSDLLATTLYDYAIRPQWANWNSLRSPIPVPESDRTRALLSFFRISQKAITRLHEAYTQGWGGHYEVTIPTVLRHYGYTLEDMGGDGSYVAPENINRFYTNTPKNPGLAPGTYVLNEWQRQKNIIPNMLYNPFK